MRNKTKNKSFSYIAIIAILIGGVFLIYENSLASSPEDDLDARVEEIFNQMTPEEKVGQLFMIYWLEANNTSDFPNGLKKLISVNKVGTVLFLETNFTNGNEPSAVNRVASLTNRLQIYNWEHNKIETASGEKFIPLFLAVDHEGDGARLTRIRDGMTPLPSLLSIGATWSLGNAENIGTIVGSELNAIGINMLLGPVIDVLDNPNNTEGNLDVRVFGGDPQWVGELGRAYIRGVHEGSGGEVITVAKHFPGHGDSNRATDKEIAITNKSIEELLEIDLVPFVKVTEPRKNDELGVTDAIMSSHIAIELTGNEPISLYYDNVAMQGGIIQVLQSAEELEHWHKNGIIVADSLGVGAIRYQYGIDYDPVEVADKAFRAGNDLLILHNIFPNDGLSRTPDEIQLEVFTQTTKIIDFFTTNYEDPFYQERIDDSVRRIIRSKLQLYPDLTLDSILIDESQAENLTGTENNLAMVQKVATQSTALIYPPNIADLPKPVSRGDNIVFVAHNFRVSSCKSCTNDWLQNRHYIG